MSDFDGKFKDYYWWPPVRFIFGSNDDGKTIQFHNSDALGFSKGGISNSVFEGIRQLQFRDLFSTDDVFHFNSSLYIKEALKWLSKD